MKLLLLGADGQVGHALERTLSPLGVVIACNRDGSDGRRAVDLAVAGQVAAAIESERPDWVVNAAAYTAVDRAESESELAHRVNAMALAEIAAAASKVAAAVLHYSTDYVFPGDFGRPCLEDDPTGPLSVYGSSKLAGEIALRDGLRRHLILRTAWVYAARGSNFLHTMLRLAADRPELRVVCDQLGAPTPAHQIAAVSALLIDRQSETGVARWGCYHLASAGQTSWHGFAAAIIDSAYARGWLPQAPQLLPISTAEFPTPARRPADSRLDCSKLHAQFGLRLPDWKVGLGQVLGDMDGAPLGPRASRPQASAAPPSTRSVSRLHAPDPERRHYPAPTANPHRAWHSRGYLPHLDHPGSIQAITFRLHDSVPSAVVDGWKSELKWRNGLRPDDPAVVELRTRLAKYEDTGAGECWLAKPAIAELVENALLHFDGQRYRLLAWCIMPNHVHVICECLVGFPLDAIVRSWKSCTAEEANRLLQREGVFWMQDYHDRYIRDENHYIRARSYVEENPVQAGLVTAALDWRWSSAGRHSSD